MAAESSPEGSAGDFPFTPVRQFPNPPSIGDLINTLDLSPHPEGGYFRRTHTNAETLNGASDSKPHPLSSSIYYLLTPSSPIGRFHRHASLTVHCLHKGKGRYVLIHDDGKIETFPVGLDVDKGERMQWIVGGEIWKASWSLGEQDEGLLISEVSARFGVVLGLPNDNRYSCLKVVIPAFSFDHHEFLTEERLECLVGVERSRTMKWLVKSE